MKKYLAYFTIIAGTAWAQTPWPASITSLNPGPSKSQVAAVVPTGISIQTPSLDVPPEFARWSGQWNGWAERGRAADTRLVVENVTSTGATITYIYASANVNPSYSERLNAKFVGDELQASFELGTSATYRFRADGKTIEFLYSKGSNAISWGVLSK